MMKGTENLFVSSQSAQLLKECFSCCGDDTITKPRSVTVTLYYASMSAQFLIEKTTTVSE